MSIAHPSTLESMVSRRQPGTHITAVTLSLAFLLVASCAGPAPVIEPAATPDPPLPAVQREFRGAWIATVANIDWPSRQGLSTVEQQAELRTLLDRAVAVGLNAVILQVRPAADALYPSPIEPWSEYLSGQMGVAPDPYYDPLSFAVEEAHVRGLELHAWFNPFRARHRTATTPASEDHVSVARPDLVKSYGDQLWLNPGDERAREYSLSVILDVVNRYDIDGVHLDDYFYPYRISDAGGTEIDFPDDSTWAAAGESGFIGSRSDWRRSNVDRFVDDLYSGIKARKAWVRFGISPFGIWRPGYPPQIEGFDAYDEIFADSRKWLLNGWVDYFTPQLYWQIAPPQQSFPALLDWWLENNPYDRHIWPGNFTSRVMMKGQRGWASNEIVEQVAITRSRAGATGNVHFSMKSLMRDSSDASYALAANLYREPALVPETEWLGGIRPSRPVVTMDTLGTRVLFELETEREEPWLWVVRTLADGRWRVSIEPGWKQLVEYPGTHRPEVIVVSAVSRLGLEGPARRLDVRRSP